MAITLETTVQEAIEQLGGGPGAAQMLFDKYGTMPDETHSSLTLREFKGLASTEGAIPVADVTPKEPQIDAKGLLSEAGKLLFPKPFTAAKVIASSFDKFFPPPGTPPEAFEPAPAAPVEAPVEAPMPAGRPTAPSPLMLDKIGGRPIKAPAREAKSVDVARTLGTAAAVGSLFAGPAARVATLAGPQLAKAAGAIPVAGEVSDVRAKMRDVTRQFEELDMSQPGAEQAFRELQSQANALRNRMEELEGLGRKAARGQAAIATFQELGKSAEERLGKDFYENWTNNTGKLKESTIALLAQFMGSELDKKSTAQRFSEGFGLPSDMVGGAVGLAGKVIESPIDTFRTAPAEVLLLLAPAIPKLIGASASGFAGATAALRDLRGSGVLQGAKTLGYNVPKALLTAPGAGLARLGAIELPGGLVKKTPAQVRPGEAPAKPLRVVEDVITETAGTEIPALPEVAGGFRRYTLGDLSKAAGVGGALGLMIDEAGPAGFIAGVSSLLRARYPELGTYNLRKWFQDSTANQDARLQAIAREIVEQPDIVRNRILREAERLAKEEALPQMQAEARALANELGFEPAKIEFLKSVMDRVVANRRPGQPGRLLEAFQELNNVLNFVKEGGGDITVVADLIRDTADGMIADLEAIRVGSEPSFSRRQPVVETVTEVFPSLADELNQLRNLPDDALVPALESIVEGLKKADETLTKIEDLPAMDARTVVPEPPTSFAVFADDAGRAIDPALLMLEELTKMAPEVLENAVRRGDLPANYGPPEVFAFLQEQGINPNKVIRERGAPFLEGEVANLVERVAPLLDENTLATFKQDLARQLEVADAASHSPLALSALKDAKLARKVVKDIMDITGMDRASAVRVVKRALETGNDVVIGSEANLRAFIRSNLENTPVSSNVSFLSDLITRSMTEKTRATIAIEVLRDAAESANAAVTKQKIQELVNRAERNLPEDIAQDVRQTIEVLATTDTLNALLPENVPGGGVSPSATLVAGLSERVHRGLSGPELAAYLDDATVRQLAEGIILEVDIPLPLAINQIKRFRTRLERMVDDGSGNLLDRDLKTALDWENSTRQALMNPGGFWRAATQMAKKNFTVNNYLSGFNNIIANVILEANARGLTIPEYMAQAGKALRDYVNRDKATGISKEFYDAVERTKLIDTDAASVEFLIGEGGSATRTARAFADALEAQFGTQGAMGKTIAELRKYGDALIEDVLPKIHRNSKTTIEVVQGAFGKGVIPEKFYRYGDVAPKIESTRHSFNILLDQTQGMKPGEFVILHLGRQMVGKLVKQADGGFTLGGKKITRQQYIETLVRAASRPALRKFFDYSDTGRLGKVLQTAPIVGIASPFFTWTSKALFGEGGGLVGNVLNPHNPIAATNSASVLKSQIDRGATAALRRASVINAQDRELQRIKDRLREALSYAPEARDAILTEFLGAPGFITQKVLGSWSYDGPFNLGLRNTLGAISSLRDKSDRLSEEELNEFMKPREDRTPEDQRRLALFLKNQGNQRFQPKDILQVVGLAGGPIIEGWDIIRNNGQDKFGNPLTKEQILAKFGAALVGGTMAKQVELGFAATGVGPAGGKPRDQYLGEIEELKENFGPYAIRRLLGFGLKPVVLQAIDDKNPGKIERYVRAYKKALKGSLVRQWRKRRDKAIEANDQDAAVDAETQLSFWTALVDFEVDRAERELYEVIDLIEEFKRK